MDEYKIGDTVRLKSGGPVMTITKTGTSDGEPTAWVNWFDSGGSVKTDAFPLKALDRIDK